MGTSRFGIPITAVAVLLAGCSSSGTDVDSDQVVTRNIWAGMNLEAKGNGNTRVKVELNENRDGGSNIRLSANERLEVNASGLVVTLEEDLDLADIDYEGSVPTDVGGTLFRISLYRADGTINGGSIATIPEPFEIASPVRRQNYTVGDDIPIIWNGAGFGTIELLVSTQCPAIGGGTTFSAEWFEINDTGTRLFDTRKLRIAKSTVAVAGSRCDLQIELERERRGTLDSAFRGGGFVVAKQVRSVDRMTLRLQ